MINHSSKNEVKKEISHIALIMDGNGRWASSRGLPRYEGHVKGLRTLRKLLRDLKDSKLDYLKFLTKKHNLSFNQTCAIGDGANDIKMVKASSMGVSFKGKQKLKRRAEFILDYSDLTGLLFLQGFTKKEISK